MRDGMATVSPCTSTLKGIVGASLASGTTARTLRTSPARRVGNAAARAWATFDGSRGGCTAGGRAANLSVSQPPASTSQDSPWPSERQGRLLNPRSPRRAVCEFSSYFGSVTDSPRQGAGHGWQARQDEGQSEGSDGQSHRQRPAEGRGQDGSGGGQGEGRHGRRQAGHAR